MKRPYEAYEEELTDRDKAQAEEPEEPVIYDDIEAIFDVGTIRTRQPTDQKSRSRRHWEHHKRRVRMMIIAASVVSALAILASIAWYLYSPVYGYGDLSENVSAEMISKARSRFTVEQYYDKKEGVILSYNIYIPFEYDRSKHYPLVFSIADSASVGTDTEKPLNMNFGGAIWATDRMQSQHPCFVVVPNYPENVIGSGVGAFTRYTDITARMIDAIVKKYNINARDVYGVGQGMGASMLIHLAAEDPDIFDSLLLVDGGVVTSEMCDLSRSRFVYIAAAGDSYSIEGQQKVKAKLTAAGSEYGELGDADAGASVDALNDQLSGLLSRGYDRNFITWRKGSVGWSLFYGEQRVSYRFGFKAEAIRDWLFNEEELTDNL